MKIPSFRRGLRFLVTLAFCVTAFFAVKAVDPAPTSPVSNVTFAQRTDGSKQVDIRYTLTGGSSGIAVALSLDGGATYSAITSATGDVGATVSAGTSKLIVWNAGTEYPNTSSANVRFRVTPLFSGAGGSFAPIPGGTYSMGNLVGDADITDAGTVSVTLSPYSMSVNATTKAQWDAVRTWAASNGYSDLPVGSGRAPSHPVYNVSWYDSVKWANAASEMDGLTPAYKLNGVVYRAGVGLLRNSITCDWKVNGYRLPTEAEWEIAARGGLKGKRFPWGDTISHNQANYTARPSFAYDLSGSVNGLHPDFKEGVGSRTSPVGSFVANGYGLNDMAGNVPQWCWDCYEIPYTGGIDPRPVFSNGNFVERGGAWALEAKDSRSASRRCEAAGSNNASNSFRLARGRSDNSGSSAVSTLGALDATPLQPTSPVSNVTFAQRTDGSKLVDVRYTLTGGSSGVALAFSVDGGTTYTAVSSVTGDVGTLIASGTSKQIVWNAGTDYPNASSANVRFRITPLLSGAGGSFVPIPGGTYSMGNLVGDADITDAGTVSVTLSPYSMSVHATTKAQWDAVRTWAAANGYTDLAAGAGKDSNHPVVWVSWSDVVKWANAASEKEGLTPCYKLSGAVYRTGTSGVVTCDWTANGYRLPTEAEWEIAARGGLKGKRFPWGDTISQSEANYRASSSFAYDSSGSVNDYHPTYKTGQHPYTSPVGVFAPNGYGLYDMAGNVGQWCWNWSGAPHSGGTDPRGPASGADRVLRGGDWSTYARYERSAFRYQGNPATGYSGNGLRLACSRAGSAAVSALGAVDTTPLQPTSPVSNVTFAQRTDGSKLVDVRYTLSGGSAGIAVALSLDGGATYSAITSATGDVGATVSAGTSKLIVWNAGTEYPNTSSADVRFRVTPLLSGAGGSFAPIPGGTYQMGNLIGDADITDAGTVSVTLSPYSMSVNDTTKAQWDAVRTWAAANGYTDLAAGGGKAANHPVHSVSWYDTVKWANAASEKEGLTPCYKLNGAVLKTGRSIAVTCDWTANGYRLPTEAEWQIAARGGLKGKRFPWGDTISHSQANYAATSSVSYDRSGAVNDYHPTYKTGVRPFTSPVGSFAPNGYGLFGMAGEVFRWCWDWYSVQYSGGLDPRGPASGTTRIRLGGSWFVSPEFARSARRHALDPVAALDDYGFRLARSRADGSGSAAVSALGALDTKPTAKLFQDVTPQMTGLAGYSGAVLRDVANANGDSPYYLATTSDSLKLYSQTAPFQFADVSAKVLPAGFTWTPGTALLVADFDNNGAQDLVLWEPSRLRVLLNTAGVLKEAPLQSELNRQLAELRKTLIALSAADLDGDGDLDIVLRYAAPGTAKPGRVACVYNDATRNAEGRQSWAPGASGFARVADVLSVSYGYGYLSVADLNLDGKVDLILGEKASNSVSDNYQQRPLHFFLNRGAGVLEENGTPLTGMADYPFAFADYQGTGRLDMIQGSSDWPWAGSYPHAYWSGESGVFAKSEGPVLERVSGDYHFYLSTADFDLDGRADAFWRNMGRYFGPLSTGPLRMWRTVAPKTFQDVSSEWGFAYGYPAGYGKYEATVADFDNDGAPDLLIASSTWTAPTSDVATRRLYRNNAARNGANYLKVRLTGVASPRDGSGARIEVRTGSNVAVRYKMGDEAYGGEPCNLPFGLGSAKTADLVKVYWPSGKVSEVKNVPGNQWLEVVEPSAAQFEVIRGRFTWPEALADAAKRGGRPAVLSTPELLRQANALQVGADAVSLWIGLSDTAVNGTFRWIDESPSTGFTNWSTSEPNDFFGPASENNVEMYANGKWNDLPGTFPLPGYLLERTSGSLRITKQPESVSVNFAAPFSVSVTAEGAGNVAYQWFKDGLEISGATSGTLSVSALTRAGLGTYWAVVSEAGKSLNSEKALVTMANPPPVPTDALLAWWPLDGNAIDQGPNAIHGTLTGPTAGTDRFTRTTRALEFAGSRSATAFVDFGAADKLRVPGDSTVALWVKFADSDTPVPQILSFGSGQFELSTSAGRGPRAVQYTVGGVPLKGARLLEAGKWHHIAAVRKAGRGFLYVNGRLDAEGPMAAAPAFGKTLNLGRSSSLYDGAFAGALDDLRLYGRALTSLEIEALGSQPDGGDLLPPVIVQDPKSLLVDAGAAAQFAVRASGARGVLFYQWLKDGVELPGATSAVLTLPKVEPRHIGSYACLVSDGYANVSSASATLGVTGVNAGLWQGLVGHWKLDGNGLDSSGFANHATMRGTPAAAPDRFGSATGAFSFGGNGAYFEVGDRAAFDLNKSDATLSAWVKTSSAAESWLLSKMDPSKAGGIGIGAGAAATLASQPVTYFKLSQAGGGYQRIGAVPTMNLVAGNVYEVSAVLSADFVWSFGDVFEFNPASSYTPPYAGIIEAVTPSTQAKAVHLVGDHVEFRYRFKSLLTASGQHPVFAFWRGARQVVEIGNIELKNITTGELLTPPRTSTTLTTQWSWDSAETVKFRVGSISAPFSEVLNSPFSQITGGSFQMGDNLDKDASSPVRTISLDTYYVAPTEVTGAQWRKVRDWAVQNGYSFYTPHNDEKDDLPIVGVLWYDAVKWCNALSEMEGRTPAYYLSTGRGLADVYRTGGVDLMMANVDWQGEGYRLPTEAEWEKAARGGLVGKRFPWGDEINQANDNYYSTKEQTYDKSAAIGLPTGFSAELSDLWTKRFNPVTYFPPNGYGLYGMAGNINEWCWDGWRDVPTTAIGEGGPVRVVRGGATYAPQPGIPATDASAARVASRSGRYAGLQHGANFPGMRVVASSRKASSGYSSLATLAARTVLWGNGAPSAKRAADSAALGDNKWHLVTAVYDRKGKMTLYVDGSKRVETDITPADSEVANAHPLLIGSAVGTQSVTGSLDDVRWYNRALGDADVLALYRQSEVVDTDGDGLSDAYEYGWGRYEMVRGSFTWAEAKAQAEAKGGHLATITSEAEWQAIKTVVGPAVTTTDLWLGGTDEGSEGRWRWITGEKWNFAKWGRTLGNGQEPNSGTGENVLNLLTAGYVDRPNGFIWNDWGSTNRCGYLFERGYFTDGTKWDTDGDGVSDSDEIKNGTDPTNPDSGLNNGLVSTYRFVPGTFTWTQAKADAEAKGGHLATITTASEWDAVGKALASDFDRQLWLGASSPDNVGEWKWVTGEPFVFTVWHPGEPSVSPAERWLEKISFAPSDSTRTGRWNDVSESAANKDGYILEIEPKVPNQYSYVSGRLTWKEAKADAEKRGGHLGTITSATEWETAARQLGDAKTKIMWLGGYRESRAAGASAGWKWTTAEPFSFTWWHFGEPNGDVGPDGVGYLMANHPTWKGGDWNDGPNNHIVEGYLLEVERTAAQLNLAITTQPTPVTVPAIGGTASFSVAATGLAPLTYQWKKDGVAISGADQATLSLKNVAPAQIGKYTAVVGDASGKTVTSNEAELAITGVNSGIWSGLVAYYPFNGNANDESGNGNHGTVKGAKLATDRFGSQIQSYEFDGVNSSIEVPDSASLRPSKQTTVSAWVNIRKLGGYLRVLTKGVAIAESYGSYQLISGSNRNDTFHDALLFTIRTSDGYYVPDPPTGQPILQWVQICGTYDGQKTKLYYDGRLVAEAPSSGNLMYDASSLVIGRDSFYGQSFDGRIDDVRIYNRALSAAEVTALYDSEKALPPLITRQPVGLRMPPGSSGVLRVEASGDAPLVYQWQKDGVAISGATAQELPLNNVTEALQGSYRVRVSNGAGAVFSEAVLVDVLDPVSAVTVYVAKNGSDTTGDGTQAKPFLTIGKAVKAAAGGARILVGPGTYAERVEYAGKSLRLHSSEGAAATTLQGGTGNTVVYIDAAAANSELRGFKITGGTGRPTPSSYGTDYYGGGVHCATTALISDCIFEANGKGTPKVNSATFGGAIYSTGGKLQVVNCLIFSNYAWASGGATFTESGSIEFDHCTVQGNDATAFRGTQGGLAVGNGGRMLVRNSIVWGNTGSQLGAFGWPYSVGTEIAVEYSDIQAPNDGGGAQTFRNGTGNISGDPLFADAAAKNFALRTGSPALDKAAPGRPKEKDGTAADMGWRADRFGGEAVTFGSQLFTDVTEAVRLPRHDLLAEIDGGQGTATDRLVRVADGSLQLWRVTGAFGYRDVTVAAGLPKDLLAPGFGGFFAVGDLDNNGAQDLVVWDAAGLRVFLNTAGAFKPAAVAAAVNTRAEELFPKARGSFTLADLDNDGDLDAVFSYEETGEKPGRIAQFTNEATLDGASGRRVWLAGDGFSGVRDVMTFPWQKPHFNVTDSNADGLPDLVVLETDGSWPSDTHVSHKAHVYLNNQGGTGAGGGFGVTISGGGDATTIVGGAYVVFPHDPVMNTDKQVTIEAWVRGNSVSVREDARTTRWSDNREHKELIVFGDGSVWAIYAWAPWPFMKAPAGSVKMDGLWHHVAFTRHLTGAWEIYVDGRTVASGTGDGVSDRIIGTATPTAIRANGGIEIDEVRWSNVDRYNGPFTPTRRFETDANAVLLVHFDEGSGTQVQDSGMKRQVGTMPAGASWKPEGTKRANGLARYSIISGSYTFAEAQADAVARGGHLLTVSSATEWDAVLEELTSRATAEDLWLGAEYENSQWSWVTGETLSYTNWDGGVPGSGTAGVYSAKDSGSWKTAAAGVKLGYLLEWEPAFQEVEEAGLTAASEFSNFLSVDVDGDGLLDLVNGSSDWPSQSTPKVFYGNGDGTYRQEKAPFVGSDRYYHHVARVADIDLDGRMDGWWSGLHNFANLQARLWRGMGGGAFAEVGTEWGVDVGLPSGNLGLSGYLADWDGDGDLDLVASATGSGAGRYKVYRNSAADRGSRWLRVRLVGVESPRDGTGARVTVVSGDRSETQYVGNLSSDGSPLATQLLFGLGSAPAATQIVVTWPNGQLQYLNAVPAGQLVEIKQNTNVPDWLKFTEQPLGRTVGTGTLVVFSATAVGSGTISYQWLKDGAVLAGGTGSTYRIAAAALTSVGDYQVVASNGAAKAVSAVARLEVAVPPSIVVQPAPVNVVAGTEVVFAVDALGTAPLSYQWSKGTTVLTGKTGRTLSLPGVGAADVASYSVKVTNPAGSVTSAAAALALLTPVQITKQPANVAVTEGAPIALGVTATGSPVLKYQWYRDSLPLAGGTAATLAVSKASALDAGSYSVSVSNPAGETSSTAARVVVNLLPRVLNVEENLSVKEGAGFALVAEAAGTAPLTYVWKKNGTLVAGQTAATLSVPAATLLDSGAYTVEVRNAVGLAVASVATVAVQALPRVVTQPVGIDAVEGSSVVLSVAATGAMPLGYQWYKNGAALAGQTAPVLSLSPLSAATHGGTYRVQVSNTVGRVFSETAVVAARQALRITTQPAPAELTLGARGTFSVVASGAAPLSYQWYKDGATLPFATDDTLLVASVGKYSIGDYSVVVKDRFGNAVRSELAGLTVAGEPSTYWKGLMAHWKFAGNTRDSTPFLNHGKASNVQAVPDRFGIASSALRFSGKLNPLSKPLVSQNVTVPHADSLQPGERYTVVVWAKPEFAGETLAEVNPFMLGKRAGKDLRDSSYALGAGFGSGALDRLNGGGGQTGYVTGGTATLVDGQWQMYALTFDGGSLSLYRNGAKVAAQAAGSSAVAANTGPLRIGSGSGDGYQEWFGCLDDIRIYNKVLSAAEVADLYTVENTPPEGAVAPAAIVVQPVGYKVPEGGPVTLRVEALGGAPLAYQWKRDGAVLSGATAAEYKIAAAALSDEGSYTVEVSNSVSSLASVPAFLDVVPAVVTDKLYVSKTGNDTTGTGTSAAPFLTIAKAVQAARSGFQIQVGPGTYTERVEYRGKTLVIESTAGPVDTVIQAPAGNTAVFIDAAALNSELRGFKISGGAGRSLSATASSITFIGGGLCILTSAVVQDCIIEDNGNAGGIRFKSQASYGGGVYSTGGTTRLLNCLILANHASEAGGAVFTERGTCELDRCTVFGNTVGNLNAQVGGLAVRDAGRLVVRNSIVRGNTGQQLGALPFPNNKGTVVQIEYSTIEGGAAASQVVSLTLGAGNLSSDPLFADVAAKNFALRTGSPALDAAAPGLPREADGTPADMGYRQDRFGGKTAQTQEPLFAEVTNGAAARLPQHTLLALVDAGAGAKVDRLVRVVSGRETAVRLWRAAGEFAAEEVTAAAGLPLDLDSGLVAVGDFDNNGAQDIASWNAAGLRVYLSTAGAFKAQAVSAALVAQAKALWSQNAGELEVADMNGDGLLDLVCNSTAVGTARPGRIGVFLASGAADATGRRSWGTTGGFTEFREVQSFAWAKPVFSLADVNSDGLADLLVLETEGRAPEDTGSRRPVHVYLNKWKTNPAAGVSLFQVASNHGIVGANELSKLRVVDINGDGKLDLVNGSAAEGSAEATTPQWFEGAGDGTFTARTVGFGAGAGVGHRLFSEVDADLDGVLDPAWLGADGDRDLQVRLWRGKGSAAWQDMTNEWGVDAGLGAGRLHLDGYFSDWDGDGALDLVVRAWDDASTQGVYKVYRNLAASRGGKGVRVRLEGVRSPRDGQGAVIELTAGGRKQVQYVGNLGEGYTVTKSFGLGTAPAVEKITVRWPSGTVQEVTTFGSGSLIEIKEAVVPVDAVVLLRLPQSVVVASGQVVGLACEAVGIGSGTLTYQWFKDGTALLGATKSSYDIAAMSAANVGAYTVRLSFGTASVLTPPAAVEMAVAPTIRLQPQSVLLLAGQTARFSVEAGGTAPFTYQWFKGGTPLPGATGASLTVSDVSVASAGAYTVKVSNGMGSVTSAVANLTLAVAPSFTVQPAGGTFAVGATVVLTPGYSGTAPLSYQWYKDGASIVGGTAATLALTPAAVSKAGVYTVTVSNAFGSADSAAAAVQVVALPSILEQPSGVSVLVGQPFKLSVRTTVGAAQTFQWFKGTAAVAGATGAEYAVAAAQVADAGSYFVKVTNSAGTVQSVTVAVAVNVPPSITTQPVAVVVKQGLAATLSVVAQGSATLTYQWQKNGVNIPAATAATYAIKAAVAGDAGLYSVKVGNAFGAVQSNEVEVSVLALPAITQQPSGLAVALDERVSFSVVAVGSGTLTYQWRKAGAPLAGATSASYTIAAAKVTDAGSYDVVVTNAVGSVTSSAAALAVSVPPTIVTQPANKTLNPGAALSLGVTATGTAPLLYQWSKDGQPVAGATAATYTVAAVQLVNAGTYTVVVSNSVGKATSQAATVSINSGVTITTQPVSVNVNPGASATFSVTATGTGPLTYQWRKAGVAIPGATSATYTIAAVSTANVASYDVVVGNPVAPVVSAVAKLALNQPVAIVTQPVGRTLSAGGSLALTVVATGTDPKTYQWRKDGVALVGGTAAAFSIPSVQTTDAGTYTVVVSNVVNNVTSAPAVVQLGLGVNITAQPVSLTVNPGTLAVFSVTATGGGTLTYQWKKAGVNLAGGTSSSFRIAAAKTTDAGTYTVVVSNSINSVTSSPAELVLNTPAAITTQPVGATINAGAPYTFRVVATGSAPLVYQWLKGGVAIAGATSATYTIASPGSADTGSYSVKVSNMVNAVTSTAVNLTVAGPPAITANPVAVQVVAGSGGSLTAKVRSTLALTYQWKKDGVTLSNGSLYTNAAGTVPASAAETTLTLSLLNASDRTPGSYTLFVTNAQGNATSTGAAVTVSFSKPKFLEVTLVKAARTFDVRSLLEPIGPTLPAGLVATNETIRVNVLGSGPITYAWRYTTLKASTTQIALTSQTGASLDFSATGVNRGPGNYYCKATSGTASTEMKFVITSFGAALAGAEVSASGAPLEILSEPASVSASAGGVVVLGVSATAGKRTFAWFREGTDGQSVLLSAGSTGFLRLDPVRASDAGAYFVVVTDPEGNSVKSRPAVVTILTAAD